MDLLGLDHDGSVEVIDIVICMHYRQDVTHLLLRAYQCYAPLPPVRAIVGQGGDLNINCPNIRDIPYNQIPLQKVGDYWGFATRSVNCAV